LILQLFSKHSLKLPSITQSFYFLTKIRHYLLDRKKKDDYGEQASKKRQQISRSKELHMKKIIAGIILA